MPDAKKELQARRALIDRCVDACSADIEQIGAAVTSCLREGGTVFACGNGGSASQAEHFAAELVGRYLKDRESLPAYALSVNTPVITAIANDFSFARVFSRQLEGLAKEGDLLLAISTSGNSANVVEACRTAKTMGVKVCALTGQGGGSVAEESDVALRVPRRETPLIQEMHLIALHLICQFVEDAVTGD